jgi:hypothetical protein
MGQGKILQSTHNAPVLCGILGTERNLIMCQDFCAIGEWSGGWFACSHPCAVYNIICILLLTKVNPFYRMGHLNAQEII